MRQRKAETKEAVSAFGKMGGGEQYSVRVRTYSKVDGSGAAIVYSRLSAVKKIKVK